VRVRTSSVRDAYHRSDEGCHVRCLHVRGNRHVATCALVESASLLPKADRICLRAIRQKTKGGTLSALHKNLFIRSQRSCEQRRTKASSRFVASELVTRKPRQQCRVVTFVSRSAFAASAITLFSRSTSVFLEPFTELCQQQLYPKYQIRTKPRSCESGEKCAKYVIQNHVFQAMGISKRNTSWLKK